MLKTRSHFWNLPFYTLLTAVIAGGMLAPSVAKANEIGWKCGYITTPSTSYSYKQAKVKGFPDKIDCVKKYKKDYPTLVIAKGFSGTLSDQEIRSKVASIANASR